MKLLKGLFFFTLLAAMFLGGACFQFSVDESSEPKAHLAPINTQEIVSAASGRLGFSNGHGSATIGYYKGRLIVLTAGHCFNDQDDVGVFTMERSSGPWSLRVKCQAKDYDKDLAWASLEDRAPPLAYPNLDPAEAITGESFREWHFTLDFEKIDTLGRVLRGKAKGWRNWSCDMTYVNGEAVWGASGSGIWVDRGLDFKLAGVLVGGPPEGTSAPKVCVHGSVIREFLKGVK